MACLQNFLTSYRVSQQVPDRSLQITKCEKTRVTLFIVKLSSEDLLSIWQIFFFCCRCFANLRFSFVWNLSGHPVDIPFMVLLSQTLLPHVLFLKGNEVQQKQCKPKCIYNVYTFRAIPLPQLSLDLILLRKIENHSLPVTILNKIGNVQLWFTWWVLCSKCLICVVLTSERWKLVATSDP